MSTYWQNETLECLVRSFPDDSGVARKIMEIGEKIAAAMNLVAESSMKELAIFGGRQTCLTQILHATGILEPLEAKAMRPSKEFILGCEDSTERLRAEIREETLEEVGRALQDDSKARGFPILASCTTKVLDGLREKDAAEPEAYDLEAVCDARADARRIAMKDTERLVEEARQQGRKQGYREMLDRMVTRFTPKDQFSGHEVRNTALKCKNQLDEDEKLPHLTPPETSGKPEE